MASEYFESVTAIMTSGAMTNSYKPALLRALSEYGASGRNELEISHLWLAEKFLSYYWSLALTYKVRQATIPGKDPVVMRLIRAEAERLRLPSNAKVGKYKQEHRQSFEELITRLSIPGQDGCLDDVVPRFHTVRNRALPRLYMEQPNSITLKKSQLKFIQENSDVLRLLAIGRWVKFTEKYSTAPRLYEKIENKAGRGSLASYRKILTRLNLAERCFYCEQFLEGQYDADHFVPWSFVLENKLWNLVAACRKCNQDKDVSIPQRWLEKLHERNRLLAEISHDHGVTTALSEWDIRSLQQHLDLLCDTALAEGFTSWEPRIP
jgi:hypothetical protein